MFQFQVKSIALSQEEAVCQFLDGEMPSQYLEQRVALNDAMFQRAQLQATNNQLVS